MKTIIFLLLSAIFLIGGCESTQSKSTPESQDEPVVIIDALPEPLKEVVEEDNVSNASKKLIFNTKLSVNPGQPNWVLFSNGTYILFPKGTSAGDMRQSALGILQRYSNQSFKVNKSPLVKGWVASTKNGIYNYVSLSQASSRQASNRELAGIGKKNVLKDKSNPIIIHINLPKQ